MFILQPSTERARKVVVWLSSLPDRPEFMKSIDRSGYPFRAMHKGQSFFMRYAECTPYQIAQGKKYARLYNKKYNRWFEIVLHKEFVEIARIE